MILQETERSLESVDPAPPKLRDWWSPAIDARRLRLLLQRRNVPGLLFLGAWLAGVSITTTLLAVVWGGSLAIPMLVVHGGVLSFAYAASHELAHGTAFKTRWLNESAFYLTSFIFGEEPMLRRYSHTRHHTYTWYPDLDSQMPYRNPITMSRYLRETLGVFPLLAGLAQMWRHASGRLTDEERLFVPGTHISRLIWGSRAFLAGYVGLGLVCVLTQQWFVLSAFFGARVAGGWIVQLFINSQHMCMAEAKADHRYTTRSIACSLPLRLVYWNMNFHVEHHLFPGVPFHALPALHREIRNQLRVPVASVLHANRQILATIRRQRTDPGATSSYAVQDERRDMAGPDHS